MRILDRHLLRSFLWPLAATLFVFVLLFIVIDAFNDLDEMLRSAVSPGVVAAYYAYFLPSILVQVLPVAVLVAVLIGFGGLNRHNEISAMRAGGVSSAQILAPLLFVGSLLSFSTLLVNELIVPRTSVMAAAIKQGLIERGKHEPGAARAIKNVTLATKNGRIIFAREYRVGAATLHDVVVLDEDPTKLLRTKTIAKRAVYEDGRWIFNDAMSYRLNRRGGMIGEPEFKSEVELPLEAVPDDFLREGSQIEFMSAKNLHEYITRFKGTGKNFVRRLTVDFHYKIAFPFVTLVVMLIGAPLALRTRRGSAMLGIGMSLGVVLLYYGVHSICLALGKGGVLPPVFSAWFSNALFAGAGIYLIRHAG